MKINLAENIRALRKQRGLTQEQLAEVFDVSSGAVYKWEAGLSVPELSLIMELADFFDTSVDVLLGYELRDNRLETTLRRLKEARRDHMPEGLDEAERALKKYPNAYEIVYTAGSLYQVMGIERRDERMLNRAIELLERSLLLLPQNAERTIAEHMIYGQLARTWLSMGKSERAVELLKAHNAEGCYSDLIGLTLAADCNRPEDAMRYLSEALLGIITSLSRVAMGYLNAFDEQGDHIAARDVLRWAIATFSGLREANRPCFLDKLLAVLHSCLSYECLKLGDEDAARQLLSEAKRLAERFDAAPDYATQAVRFIQPSDESVYDDMGATAMEAVENVVSSADNAPLLALWKAI
ncbi:MAG: helix-turn-helix transcriptional regulator [Clostridia bacterium]|nr:helix-turn-helix transcriptional regulator [Clostridia bacterium]